MKVIQSIYVRALCAIVVGGLLIMYREETVTWLTVAIGVLFFLSGIVSCATFFALRRASKDTSDGETLEESASAVRPAYPIVGAGSLILGAILSLMPDTFIAWQVYLLAALLILGALNQFVGLGSLTKYCRIGLFYWMLPSLALLVGIVAIVKPSFIASAPLLIIGLTMILYGVTECLNGIKSHSVRRNIAAKAAETPLSDDENSASVTE
ncbi:MAG: DUF308 domain-containing protein [Hoylesella marshii]|uniref:DUF308 domain-containing protein n=1 Tax=Hoylesella marshii TaxID=189722 RepID=UPI003F9F369E